MITGLDKSPGKGDLFMNGAQATGSPACPSQRLVSSTVWIAIAPGTLLITGGRLRSGLLSLKKIGGPALSSEGTRTARDWVRRSWYAGLGGGVPQHGPQ